VLQQRSKRGSGAVQRDEGVGVTEVCIGLGANLGEPLAQLNAAVMHLEQLPNSQITAVSSVYQSAPMGPQDQPNYLNAAVSLETDLTAEALLKMLKDIEVRLGRQPTRRWGERVIDLDILLFGTLIHSSASLTIPHTGLSERAFVLLPLMELLGPRFVVPGGDEIGTLWQRCDQSSIHRVTEAALQTRTAELSV